MILPEHLQLALLQQLMRQVGMGSTTPRPPGQAGAADPTGAQPTAASLLSAVEVNLVILFSDGHLLTENFPLKLVRTELPAEP